MENRAGFAVKLSVENAALPSEHRVEDGSKVCTQNHRATRNHRARAKLTEPASLAVNHRAPRAFGCQSVQR